MLKPFDHISPESTFRSLQVPLSISPPVLTVFCVLACFVFLCTVPADAGAVTPKEQYYQAKAQYASLLKNPAHQKRRDKWLACIDSFERVYRMDPNGPWAAAGMFRAGELYEELYRRSGRTAYRNEAMDRFERIIKRYPQSRYVAPSRRAIAATRAQPKTTVSRPDASRQAALYARAETCYRTLMGSPKKQRYRDQWTTCIDRYDAAYRVDADGTYAPACLFDTAELYRGLHRWSHRRDDREKALENYQKTIMAHPGTSHAEKAESRIVAYYGKNELPTVIQPESPKIGGDLPTSLPADPSDDIAQVIAGSDTANEPEADDSPGDAGGVTVVQGLRSWSNPGYTRIVIDADRETRYSHHVLKPDPSINKPPRLYVDLMDSVLKKGIDTSVPINDNLLSKVRAGQYRPDAVRVVIDIKSYKYYKIFKLSNPFRIVIDVRGEDSAVGGQQEKAMAKSPEEGKIGPGELAKQLALGVRTIVIDPGHGGRDYGAPGYYKGVHEKHIVLAIAKRLKEKIEAELNCEVYLTRSTDRYLTLEERTAIANTKNADLFISIHTNSAKDSRAYGIETYFLNLATDDEAIRVAAIENQTSTKNISDLETILNDLMQNAKIHESSRLATHVQSSLNLHMRKSYNRIKNKGVKQAPFYVLLGAQMPSILVETSFISNARECKRLTTAQYQEQLCNGIVIGIRKYIQDINPTAFYRQNTQARGDG